MSQVYFNLRQIIPALECILLMQQGHHLHSVGLCGNSNMSGRLQTSRHMYLREESPQRTWNSVVLISETIPLGHYKSCALPLEMKPVCR